MTLATAAPTALLRTDLALAEHGAHGRRWLEGMWRGDPLADAVVADGAPLVRRAIARGVEAVEDPPPPLLELFAALDAPPEWVDPRRCDRGAEHLARQSREYGFVLGAASLLAGAQNTVAGKPLTFTGRYASDAALRSVEVASWLTAVTTPGGLRRDGPGFERTVRVRMIHAHVRRRLREHPGWRLDAWGLPIPQPYMAFTLAEFCSVALRAMARLGARYTDAELDDILHLWRCVGWLVGVEEDLLPATLADYERIESLFALTSPGPDDGDREFVAALTAFQAAELARRLPSRWAPRIVQGLQRAFVGERVADELGVPDSWCKRLPVVLGPLTAAAYGAHDALLPDGKARRTRRAYRRRARELQRLRDRYRVGHELVDDAPG